METLDIWTKDSGFSLGSYEETTPINISLSSLTKGTPGVSYNIIAGALPKGLSLSNTAISGIATEVTSPTIHKFCIRATFNGQLADRTFSIQINGYDPPVYKTNTGLLPIGPNGQLFVIDGTFVSYQLQVEDSDVNAGQILRYSLKDGALPKGLTMSSSGLISGIVQPIIQTRVISNDGSYDYNYFDAELYDYGENDTYARKLNRYYEFIVNLSDGGSIIPRTFKIFVIGDDYFRADVTTWTVDTTEYTSDVAWLIPPEWETPSYLGTYRANNNLLLKLDTYATTLIHYEKESINADILATAVNAEINDNKYGNLTTTFTASTAPEIGTYLSYGKNFGKAQWCEYTIYSKGVVVLYSIVSYVCKIAHTSSDSFENDKSNLCWIPFNVHNIYKIIAITPILADTYRATLNSPLEIDVPADIDFYIGSLCTYPPDITFDPTNGELFGEIPVQMEAKKTYKFTITAVREYLAEKASSSRIFTLDMLSDITQQLTWTTESDLGELGAGYVSDLTLGALATEPNTQLLYSLMDGEIPPGLTLSSSGDLTGSVIRYSGNITQPTTFNNSTIVFDNGSTTIDSSYDVVFDGGGLITFDSPSETENTTFDSQTTTLDRKYTFTAQAVDPLSGIAVDKMFTITANAPEVTVAYSNIRVQPYLPISQRVIWGEFINNSSIFTPTKLFRVSDLAFGIQRDLSMLIYAGIETVAAEKYVSAMGTHNKKKRFYFGELTKAVARYPGTTQTLYEVVYINMVDPLEQAGVLPSTMKMVKDQHVITADISNKLWELAPSNNEYLHSDYIVDINTNILTHNTPIQIDVYANSAQGLGTRPLYWTTEKMHNNLSADAFEDHVLNGDIPIRQNSAQLRRSLAPEFVCGLHKHFAIEIYLDKANPSSLIYRSPPITMDEEGILAPIAHRPKMNITADSTSYLASDIHIIQRHPSSMTHWRNNITEWNDSILKSDRNYIPLWMRTVQPTTRAELGFVSAVVLCYCVPGMADDIIANIRHYISTNGFSFNQLDFIIDRYIINAVKTAAGISKQDKYLIFRDDRSTLT